MNSLSTIRIYFKSYKKNTLNKVFSDFKINENNNKKYKTNFVANKKNNTVINKIQNIANTQLYNTVFIKIKDLIKKYALLRATHEFKYSWEKYKEVVYKATCSIDINLNRIEYYLINNKINTLKNNWIISFFLKKQYVILCNTDIWCKIIIKYPKYIYPDFYLDQKIFNAVKE